MLVPLKFYNLVLIAPLVLSKWGHFEGGLKSLVLAPAG